MTLTELREAVKAGTATAGELHSTMQRNGFHAIDAYNGSLDAAKALHDALLPGRGCAMNYELGYAAVYGKGIDGKVSATVKDNPARAWLLAILDALIQEERG